jgi:hypothetical protein
MNNQPEIIRTKLDITKDFKDELKSIAFDNGLLLNELTHRIIDHFLMNNKRHSTLSRNIITGIYKEKD